MNTLTNTDEAPPSFDYIQNWASANEEASDPVNQAEETLENSSNENGNNNGSWFGVNRAPSNTNGPSTNPFAYIR